eukprot:GCRY01003764.1.p1 GENE.GCRY01003764.1~~GCRY01003764.1.p1  ORF type:complete len:231 (-),score=51.38 GCRY01003764.1:842-1534(-)
MATSPTAKQKFTMAEWENKLQDVHLETSEVNRLVMEYLVTEGYLDAAEKLKKEADCEVSHRNEVAMHERVAIRNAIQEGRIPEAINLTNDLNPEILDNNKPVYFHLQQQQLIELIREGEIAKALVFAQEELAPLGQENSSFLAELEETLSLLAFDPAKTSPVSHLLQFNQRQKIASEVNAAILEVFSVTDEARLPTLLRMLAWAQGELDQHASYPRINHFETAHLEAPEN